MIGSSSIEMVPNGVIRYGFGKIEKNIENIFNYSRLWMGLGAALKADNGLQAS
jgi:hypothetical protein